MKNPLRYCIVAIPVVLVLLLTVCGLCGCAYLNGDAMWLGKDQKDVAVSNTLLTWTSTEYEFDEGNLPFRYTCKPSKTPYEFMVELPTNGAFKVRIIYRADGRESEKDTFIAVSNGIASVYCASGALEWRESGRPEKCGDVIACPVAKCGTVIPRCGNGLGLHICPRQGRWVAETSSDDHQHSYYVEGKFMPEKLLGRHDFIIEECLGAKFSHLSNWYDW